MPLTQEEEENKCKNYEKSIEEFPWNCDKAVRHVNLKISTFSKRGEPNFFNVGRELGANDKSN